MIRESGFEIIEQQIERPDKIDLKSMLHISLADKNKRKYDIKDLGVKTLCIVLKKKVKTILCLWNNPILRKSEILSFYFDWSMRLLSLHFSWI